MLCTTGACMRICMSVAYGGHNIIEFSTDSYSLEAGLYQHLNPGLQLDLSFP